MQKPCPVGQVHYRWEDAGANYGFVIPFMGVLATEYLLSSIASTADLVTNLVHPRD